MNDESRPPRPRRAGCALAAVAMVGALVGAGLWLGRIEKESMTPCQRYAEVVARELDNCHSGQNRDHLAQCEQLVDPTEACLRRIEELTCEELERGPASTAGEACRKRP